jgi:hypothetical protein
MSRLKEDEGQLSCGAVADKVNDPLKEMREPYA